MQSLCMAIVSGPTSDELALFLVQVMIILSLVRILGRFLVKIRQPMVIGEIIAGILLGPSAFGQIPNFTDSIFPTDSLAHIKLFANIGLIFFMVRKETTRHTTDDRCTHHCNHTSPRVSLL